jgi:hypothetical protein
MVGPMSVKNFPKNINTPIANAEYKTLVDYNATPNNQWGNRRLMTKGIHNSITR